MNKRPAGSHHVQFGATTITFELLYSDRKRLAVHVYPDCSVEVDAPDNTALSDVYEVVKRRAAWILKQQRAFSHYPSTAPSPRRYVSGESYRYLGRQYRLKVNQDTVERVVLSRGYLTVGVHDPADKRRIQTLLDDWHLQHARRVFAERLAACYPRVEHLGIGYPPLLIRAMKARWGSCSPSGKITLNLKLLQAPKSLIDYVILHELCHLHELNHTAAFYALLSRVQPNWKRLRKRLNEFEF